MSDLAEHVPHQEEQIKSAPERLERKKFPDSHVLVAKGNKTNQLVIGKTPIIALAAAAVPEERNYSP